jgi:hypothetical protein
LQVLFKELIIGQVSILLLFLSFATCLMDKLD